PPAPPPPARAGGGGAVPGIRDARWRPARPVAAARARPPPRPRPEPAGGDRRARVPHRPLPELLLPAPGGARVARGRGALRGGNDQRAPRPRPRRHRDAAMVA